MMGSFEKERDKTQWPSDVLDRRVSIAAGLLPKIQARLETKKQQLGEELKEVGFQPKSTTHAIFNQCRVFDSVFRKKLNETHTTSMIRDAFLGPRGLRENITRLKLDTFFNETYVRQICRQADGFQPHLVSPEKGLKLLVKEAMSYVLTPAEMCVDDVKLTLVTTIQNAASDLSKHTFAEETKSLRPTSQQMLMEICEKAVDVWSDEAKEMAMKLVNMEGDYITSSFFRRLAESRAAEMAAAADADDSDCETPLQSLPEDQESLRGIKDLGGNARDYMMGYLEKNSEFNQGGFRTSIESWQWQKRWFVLSDAKYKLYYFRNPDELPHYRGVIDMASCVVEDLAADTKKSTQMIGGKSAEGSFSLLISLSSVEHGKPILKDHPRVILRAEDAASKYEWLARLRQCVAKSKSGGGAVPRRSSTSMAAAASSPPAVAMATQRRSSVSEVSPMKSVWGDILNEEPRGKKPGSPFSAYFKQTLKGKLGKDSQFFNTLGNDLGLYTQMVLESLCRTIPKAIVHCQVKRAETELLEQLYADVNELSRAQLESMTFEGSEVTQRRAALLNASGDIGIAMQITNGLASSVSGLLDETETIEIPSYVMELAGMSHLLGRGQDNLGTMPVGPYTPKALRSTHPESNSGRRDHDTRHYPTGTNGNGTTGAKGQSQGSGGSPVRAQKAPAAGQKAPSPAPPTRIKPRRRPPPPPRKQ
mmetsp:Transcript_29663/g.63105  ORF Transcript_29663/g.63105 Transcript_29663/m.63105 type:complete len:704 (+) Transcript_29663:206-2317(+)